MVRRGDEPLTAIRGAERAGGPPRRWNGAGIRRDPMASGVRGRGATTIR
ncbi:hypothetical protein FM112_10655 [Gulosibacter sp. 10]|nr:hypothetical protein FM112_10655 [Gulosibacter sp. 10]